MKEVKYEVLTIEDVKCFLMAHYKHERLYGRTAANGWHDDYGDNIVRDYYQRLHETSTPQIISKHESHDGKLLTFGASAVIKFHYSQMNKEQALKERARVNELLRSEPFYNVSHELLKEDKELLVAFSILNARRNILNSRLKYNLDHYDEENAAY